MMHYELTETTAKITCTFDELARMDNLDQCVYATPSPDGKAQQLYVASQPQWRDDFVIASISDFCEAEGWDSLGWEEMSQDEMETVADDQHTVEVPRFHKVD